MTAAPRTHVTSAMGGRYVPTELRASQRPGAMDAQRMPSRVGSKLIEPQGKTCLGCGARQQPDGSLPCGH